ncbi:MAG: CHAT domain-containing protein, partial [Acidobacteriota bacterium]
EINDRSIQAVSLTYLGVVNSDLGKMGQALSYFNQALALWRAASNQQKVADTLIQIGVVYRDTGEKHRALDFFSQALSSKRELNDLAGQRAALIDIGVVHLDIGNSDKALDYFNQAVTLRREGNDPRSEAATLNNIGVVCSNRGEKLVALDFFQRALKLRQEAHDQAGEADTLHNIGVVHSDLDDKRQALSFFERALALVSAMGNRSGQANALNSLGFIYSGLGDKRKALDYYQQSLPIRRAVGDRGGEAYTLNNIGAITASLGEKKQSLDYFNQALKLWRAVNDPAGQAKALTNLGVVNSDLEDRQKALSFFDQALKLWRGLGNRTGEAYTLANLGFVFALQNEKQRALDHLSQSLVLFRELKSLEGSGAALHYLMLAWKMFDSPDLAILHGKLAVDAYQEIRTNIQGLDKELRQSFIKSKEDVYRELADLLISEGRLPEAQQVIGLLKEEEYFEFVRRDKKEVVSLPGRAALTPEEAKLLEEYGKLAGRVTAIGVEISSLEAKPLLSEVEEQRLTQLEAERTVANQFFHKFLARLAIEVPGKKRITVAQISESQNLAETLKELGAGTVAIYTLVTAKKYRVIIITAYSQKAAEYPISAVELNRKVLEFRQVLQEPRGDPRPLAYELYKILVAPIAKDLVDAKAQTLMWSLDGALRYLPLAALYDGEKYLVERYQSEIFTPASMINLKDQPQAQWKGLGLGVSKAHAGFRELPAVREELRAVIRDEGDGNVTNGVLPGRVLLDEQFTESAMRQALRQRYPLVHIASHFHFNTGNETDSSLLLGDGQYLTLARVRTASSLFGGVDLLSLSACNTAMSGAGADGKEVEGFGVLAQRQGAKAVVATLWSVADESTAALMKRFYQLRNAGAGMSKVEALRQAQLTLLRGEELGTQTASRRTPEVQLGPPGTVRKSPAASPRDSQAPYAHPYYWAPFILIGNWK